MVQEETYKGTKNLVLMMCNQICGRICQMQQRRKQRWAIEKPKLDNPRQLRGMFFIEPNDEEFKLTMKAARRKLEVPMSAAMPCKIPIKSSGETHRNVGKRKTKYACVVEFIPMLQAMKIPDSKAAVENEWEKVEKIPAWQLTKVRNKKEVIDEARHKGRKVHFASLMDLCHLENSELELEYQKYKGRVVLRGDVVSDDSGSYAVFTELPGCSGQAADAVSAFSQVKMEDAQTL